MQYRGFMRHLSYLFTLLLLMPAGFALAATKPANVIFVLTDDQRYDELGFMNPVLDTPNMDKMANEGVHFKNAFVTTALCSPSRASILTGQYMHNHGVVDNNAPPKEGTTFFSSYLKEAGYNTAFVGKWHMGESRGHGAKDAPQPGFDHWVSFPGQGNYYPTTLANGEPYTLNVDGERVPQKGYITDELTDYSIDWLEQQKKSDKPFFLYLSHKAVHADFQPAERHENQYQGKEIPVPSSQADTEENYEGKPLWVKNQRNSWHGVDFPYHSTLDVQSYKMQYHRALSAVDDSLGRIFQWLEKNGHDKDTIVVLMGDNGFMFGEHGLIDKRNAYEESMRVPLLVRGPGIIAEKSVVHEIAANIDIAPTILDIAGVKKQPQQFEGQSLLPLAKGKKVAQWRSELLYEYYWEFNYPSTPTTFALRTDDYKFITYHGVWDTEELYDIKNDPQEMHNLINDESYLSIVANLRSRLFAKLEDNNGQHAVPYTERFSSGAVLREATRSKEATFPAQWLKVPNEKGDIPGSRDFMQTDEKRASMSKVEQKPIKK
ncbi:acetylglucosamine-6-sulfatase [Paraglaciecola hydrolytica]|uniref:Acetylglucosamine-6-sulfatase n=2 Tax=Paraglaciecola hydrolytica TaxID=1799789 RepID=A0A148KMJ0_9ALTE|nr:acetylglucosamine-6-sulfatase [Paraglaciecola hydrolytica]